jgi:2-phospho-L-lactate guanylyltransferase
LKGRHADVRTVAVLPMNHLSRAKSRLADTLDPGSRRALVLWMGERVLCALEASAAVVRTVVVSPDPDVLAWTCARRVAALRQTSGGLNEGLELGRRWSLDVGADALLVLFGDLPLLTSADVFALVAAVEGMSEVGRIALAPDRADRGTNALALRPPGALPFLFGADSLSRHADAAHTAGVEPQYVRREGLSFDVDTPVQLDELRMLGLWTPAGCDARVSAVGGNR